jgi:spermidine/putrescine ABC transporter ATP-binding subunit
VPDPMIELRGVTVRYGPVLANDALDLVVHRGELLTLLGPSGCGKTTALRTLTGHVRPDVGRVVIDGRDVTHVPTHRRELGMVFQNFALFPHMTVRDNVGFPLMIRGVSADERATRVAEALRLVRLEGHADKHPRQLSGGQQQRVGLARALVYRPKVLLLDEPLSNLDAKLREEMRFEIRDVVTRLGVTAVYVTHDQEEALALSDRIAIMHRGRVEQLGTSEDIYARPASRFVAEFVGLSSFLEGVIEAVTGEGMEVRVGGGRVTVPALPGAAPGRRALLFVRPNEVEFLASAGPEAADALRATVESATYLGDRMDYRLRLDGGLALRAQRDGGPKLASGSSVRLRLPPGRVRALPEDHA